MKTQLAPDQRRRLHDAWSREMATARTARAEGDATREWSHLERAHILSQPVAAPHVRTHAVMFSSAVRRRDAREIVGQLFRILVAGPGSLTGRYPVGNTGGANVSAFRPMEVPSDLRVFFDDPQRAAS